MAIERSWQAPSGFDKLARPYRWMEYLTFGRALERCRFRFLPQLTATRSALLLGDGDGRFTARLLTAAPAARVHAVDVSGAMLGRLRERCAATGMADQLTTEQADAASLFSNPAMRDGNVFDLVATHFFLDCLEDEQVANLALRVRGHAAPGARWVISEFATPRGAMSLPSRMLVRLLYAAFRLLAGLRVQRLPNYPTHLRAAGFVCIDAVPSLWGLLRSELWVLAQEPGDRI